MEAASVADTNSVVRHSRKGEVAALNLVVAAVIVLVILVISIAIALKYSKKGDQGAEASSEAACNNDIVGGECKPGKTPGEACSGSKEISGVPCPTGKFCCKKT